MIIILKYYNQELVIIDSKMFVCHKFLCDCDSKLQKFMVTKNIWLKRKD